MRARTKYGLMAFALLAGLGLSMSVSMADTPRKASEPGTLQISSSSFPDYMDPALAYTAEGWMAMYSTYIPLLTYRHAEGENGSEVVPGLARSLPRVSDDGKTYTLFLRPGLRYSDGTPVRASDFEFAVRRMFKVNSGGSSFYTRIAGAKKFLRTRKGGIKGITADDRSGKIVIHLLEPRGTFTQELALMFVAPVPKSTPMRDQTFSPPPATGPYVLTRSAPGEGWAYERNPIWSNNQQAMPDVPSGHFDRIEVRVIRSGARQVELVLDEEIDWMLGPLPPDQVKRLRDRREEGRLRFEPMLNTQYFWMNTQKAPFDSLKVRRAVNYAVDTEVLHRIYAGELQPTHQILPPNMPGFQKYDLYPLDLAKARRLIAEADPEDRQITVWTDTESHNEEAGIYYRSVLRQLGFEPHLKVLGPLSYLFEISDSSTPDLDTGWSNWYADYAHPNDWFQPLLAGSSILPRNNGNLAQIDIPSLNMKIAKLRRTSLGPRQEREYAALDRSYMKLAPWVPIGSLVISTLSSKRIDRDALIWSPLFGVDLTSFKLR